METTNRGNLGVGAPERGSSEPGSEIRAKLEVAIEKANAVCQQLQDKTVAAAKATGKTVREHPYSAMGVAFGAGLVIGALVMRSQRD
jgi:ElaB/YqjD/DUF883 family membrane-anchored ribosome-binding protein